MIRALIIGRDSARWATALQDATTASIETETARLPAEGVRKLETTPPDAVVILDAKAAAPLANLIEGIRSRPLGKLTPVFVVAPLLATEGERLGEMVDGWFDPFTTHDRVLAAIVEALGIELDEEPDFVLEPIDDVPVQSFTPPVVPKPVLVSDADLIRKLKAVRHEDYFSILEVGRGAKLTAIREAFRMQRHRFDVQHLPFELQTKYGETVHEILDAIDDAWAVLGDDTLRAEYLTHTTRSN